MRISSRTVVLYLAMAVILTAPIVGPARAGTMQTYIVLYSAQAVPADAARTIANAGGVLVYAYNAVGVVIARSDSSLFRDTLLADSRIENVSSTAGFATKLRDVVTTDASVSGPTGPLGTPVSDTDNLSPLQWDMRQIHTPEAHAITGGSPSVLVGDIDTGIDFNHPDLAQNIDVADSVNCLSGAPVAGLAAQDDNGHGTHTAGTIAAASNGIGIVGVAPNVHIAGIKAGTADGFFFPQAVVCAFVWAGTHGVDVTNNSYFADPWLFNCRNDPVQRAIWKAEQRAIRFAMQQGTTVVAAEGNQADDLSHPMLDATSPDIGTAVLRTIHNDCVVIPVEIPGVIGVTGDGNTKQASGQGYLKSFFSSYGISTADVVAPSGDSRFGVTPQAPNGRVLSTYPPNRPCTRSVKVDIGDAQEPTVVYCYLQGTSMASPHVAGVAALIISEFGNLSSPNGKMSPGAVDAYIRQTADPQPCPSAAEQAALSTSFPSLDTGGPQICQGGTGHNSWYGDGQANALNAVTHKP